MSTKARNVSRLPWMAVAIATCAAGLEVGPAAAGERHRAGDDPQPILRQLTEIQNELKGLRDEVGLLRRAVADLPRAAARAAAPAAAPPPASVALGPEPPLGDAGATVGVVAFSDFECPFCRRFHEQTFSKLKETYIAPGKVRYAFRDFPLPMHAQARGAALAAHCAARQEAFWPMHDALFTSDRPLGPERFEAVARELKLDGEAFRACLQEADTQKAVESDLSYGQGLGVQGTPTFFIGRMKDGQLVSPQRITGAQPFATFAEVIDAFLK